MKNRLILLMLILGLGQTLAFGFNDRPIFAGTQSGQPQSPVFLELWNNLAYYDTNMEKKNFSAALGRFEGKIGFNLFDYPLQVYGVYYGVASQAPDYWDNSLFSGVGIRYFPWRTYPGDHWYNEWLQGVRIYDESLSATYFKNSSGAAALANTDNRIGLEIWHGWNQENPDYSALWGELWLKGDYRQTNFGWEPGHKFENYVFFAQPKIGRHLSETIKTYVRGDITYSGKSGPDYYFLNIADLGVGLRFEPLRNVSKSTDLFHTFNMFIELLGSTYLKDPPADVSKRVSADIRFGIEAPYGR